MCGLSISMSMTIEENWVEEGREKYLYRDFIIKIYLKYSSPFLFYAQD